MSRGLAGAFAGLCVLLWALCPAVGAQESAPAALGTISGKVLDKGTGEPMIDAGVEVVGANKRARTDLDGKYSFKVPPGTYQVRFFQAQYQGARIDDVKVVAGKTATVDAALAPEGKGVGVETVEVVAKADKQAESIQLLERKNSATVSDTIGAQTIKESPDSNAGEVVQRVPAVTVKDNKFIYVRGLGERYSQALLNGSRLPSTDPNKRVVPLDLFPSDFIESLSVVKSYTPDLPGDFSGGLVDIHLKDPPETLSYSLGLSSSGDTNTTFESFQNYAGTKGDITSFGAGSRSLPGLIPDSDIKKCEGGGTCGAQMRTYAGAFKNVWTPDSQTAPPNFSVNANVGNTFGPIGISLAGIWGLDYQTLPTEIANSFTSGGVSDPIEPLDQFTYRRSTQTARLGGVLTATYTIDSDNHINLRALDNHVGQDYVLDGSGFNAQLQQNQTQTTLYYQEQNLGYGQLEGEHHFEPLSINWRSALAQTTLNAPDSRYLTRQADGSLFTGGSDPLRTFLNLDEWMTDSAIDVTVPFSTRLPFTDVWSGLPAKFKFGPGYTYRDRNLTYRRFQYGFNSRYSGDPETFAPTETLLARENIGTDQYRQFTFIEQTRRSDQFTASQEIAALYGLIDTPIIPEQLRLIAGVRLEYSYITISGFDLSESNSIVRNIENLNPLPGFNLVYGPRPDTNVRFGYSRTTSRPEFRELTPTEFVQPLGFRRTIGNPNLISATIDSYDLRWEWFMSPLEILSFGVFYKSMTNPIEQIVVPGSSSVADSWTNATDAQLAGFEFESRKNFGFLAEPVRDHLSGTVAQQMPNLNLVLNVSYIWSNVNITPTANDIQAESSRPLQGQSPYVINAGLEYDLPDLFSTRLLYNTSGPVIAAVGTKTNGGPNVPFLPSIDQQQRGQLDFVVTGVMRPFDVPINTKFAIENILNSAYEQRQGDEITSRFRTGVQFGVSFSYAFN